MNKQSFSVRCGEAMHRIVVDLDSLTAEMHDHDPGYERWLSVHELGGEAPTCFHQCHTFMELSEPFRNGDEAGKKKFLSLLHDLAKLMMTRQQQKGIERAKQSQGYFTELGLYVLGQADSNLSALVVHDSAEKIPMPYRIDARRHYGAALAYWLQHPDIFKSMYEEHVGELKSEMRKLKATWALTDERKNLDVHPGPLFRRETPPRPDGVRGPGAPPP